MNINRRRPSQTSFTIWAENDFWALLAKGLRTQRRLSKSQFIRDAIAQKMKTDFGIDVPDDLIVPLPPHTDPKIPHTPENHPISVNYSKEPSPGYRIAENRLPFEERKSSKK